ncbi:hypothetical protein VaNZ11_015456 [Volvox africanus]|uniref:RegA n=1 Tax=Volvox africanus TaxID=51714 RepID=A0ABQ5SKV7_9CHLO|nr:hypothetical protein VaNZ11_015456 [Volvox africanus]
MQNVAGCAYASTVAGVPNSRQEWPNSSMGVALEPMIMTQRWNERASATYEDTRSHVFAVYSGATTSLPHQPGTSLAGSLGPGTMVSNVIGAAQGVSAVAGRNVASLFGLGKWKGTEGHLLTLRTSQQLSSAPRFGVIEGAPPGGAGDTGSATSASDGTVQCSELPVMRNPSSSPMNSPHLQTSTVAVSGSVAFPYDSCSPPVGQPTTSAPHAISAVVNGPCSEAAGVNTTFALQSNSGNAGLACEAEEARPLGGWRIEPETLKQEAMQGFASKNPHLPPPVRVTVGPNAFRQQQPLQQQQQSSLPSLQIQQPAAKKRGRDGSGVSLQAWGSADGEDSDCQKKRGGLSRGSTVGRGARRDGDNPDDKPILYGMFYPDRYMVGVDCILVEGTFVSRSRFEKLGGSLMAKWYRSIRVVETAEPLGTWLDRHGLPVFTGKARQRRQRVASSAKASTAASNAIAASNTAHTIPALTGDNDKVQGSSNNLGLITDASRMWTGALNLKTDTEALAATGPVPVDMDTIAPGPGNGGQDGFQANPTTAQGPCAEHLSDKAHSLSGSMSAENMGLWQGIGRNLMLGKGSVTLGLKVPGSELLDGVGNAAILPQHLMAASVSAGTPVGPPALGDHPPTTPAAPVGPAIGQGPAVVASFPGVDTAAGTGNGGSPGAGRQPAISSVAKVAYSGLETLPSGAVAPGLYLIGGRVASGGLSFLTAEQQQQLPQRFPSPLPQPQQQQQHEYQHKMQQQHPYPRGYLQHQQQDQSQQQGSQTTNGSGGCRGATDGGAHMSMHDVASAPPCHLCDPPLVGHDSTSWGPSHDPPGDSVAAESTGHPLRRFDSDGGAPPAIASQFSACAVVPSQAEANVHAGTRQPAAVVAFGLPNYYGGDDSGAQKVDAIPAQTSSCRIPETSSLESVPTSSASRWHSTSYLPSPAGGTLAQYGSHDQDCGEGSCPMARRIWEPDMSNYPYDPLPPAASAPAKFSAPTLHGTHDLQPQQQMYPLMSRQLSHELPLVSATPCWAVRAKPLHAPRAREGGPVQTPFLHEQQLVQQPFQEEAPPFPLPDGLAQPASSADAAVAQPPSLSEVADNRPTSTAPGTSSSAAAESAENPTPVSLQKPGHPYPLAGRQLPYGSQYWPYQPYPGHARGGPGLPARHSVGPAGSIRPYYRPVYPRDMPPAPGNVPPGPVPLPAPYSYYYPAPYQRRAPPMYRRRYAVSAPGAVEAQPGMFGARYDTTAMYSPYGQVRPEVEAPMEPAGQMPYSATGDFTDDMGPMAGASVPTAVVEAPNAPGASVAGAAVLSTGAGQPGRTSNGVAATFHPELQLPQFPPSLQSQSSLPAPPPQQQQVQLQVQQQQLKLRHQQLPNRMSTSASGYSSSWVPASNSMRPLFVSAQVPQPMSGVSAGMGNCGGPRNSTGLMDSESIPTNVRVGPPPVGAGAGPSAVAVAVGGAIGTNQFGAPPGFAAATVETTGAQNMTSAVCGAEADVDPMWAHFQQWSAEEAGRAPQYL